MEYMNDDIVAKASKHRDQELLEALKARELVEGE